MELELHARGPLFVRHLKNVEPSHRAGDVHQSIDAAKAIQSFLHHNLGCRGRHQVEFEDKRLRAARLDLLADLTEFLCAASRKNDCPEVACESDRRSLPDTRACAGDHGDGFWHVCSPWILGG